MVQTRSTRKREELETGPLLAKSVPGVSRDIQSIILLVVLYLLQGVPLGLCMGSIPFLLKSKLTYSELALFSLSSYPYSLKLFWSPIVDTLFIKSIGRRKSWILPMQLLLGILLLVIGSQIDSLMELDELPVRYLAFTFTLMVLLCATQDIAVDGWALEMLTEENRTFASTAQTIGLNTGYFLSFTVFLAFNSPEFCNKYIRYTPSGVGLLTLGSYLQFWGIMFLICNVGLMLFAHEKPAALHTEEIWQVYKTIFDICRMPHMVRFIGVLLICKIGFIANEAVTGLKLLELGFNKEYLAMSVLIDFPFQLLFGYYAAKWSSGNRPLQPWLYGYWGKLVSALISMITVANFPKEGVTTGYLLLVMTITVLTSFMGTIQFVGMTSFFTRIADPKIGGTYMTLLNTLSNMGGTWPQYFILRGVDILTDAPCTKDGIKCTSDVSKKHCKEAGGVCTYNRDGYYAVNTACVIFGLVIVLLYIIPKTRTLERLSLKSWRLKRD